MHQYISRHCCTVVAKGHWSESIWQVWYGLKVSKELDPIHVSGRPSVQTPPLPSASKLSNEGSVAGVEMTSHKGREEKSCREMYRPTAEPDQRLAKSYLDCALEQSHITRSAH